MDSPQLGIDCTSSLPHARAAPVLPTALGSLERGREGRSERARNPIKLKTLRELNVDAVDRSTDRSTDRPTDKLEVKTEAPLHAYTERQLAVVSAPRRAVAKTIYAPLRLKRGSLKTLELEQREKIEREEKKTIGRTSLQSGSSSLVRSLLPFFLPSSAAPCS